VGGGKGKKAPKPQVKLEIDPRLSQLYEILKQKGKIPKDTSFNEFVNQFVLNYIRNRFGITIAVVEGMDGEPTYKIVEDEAAVAIKAIASRECK
jgi:hypothetical protein